MGVIQGFMGLYTLSILSFIFCVHATPTPEDYLRLHNNLRAAKSAEPLIWNENLAVYAQDYARLCVKKHSKGEWGGKIVTRRVTEFD